MAKKSGDRSRDRRGSTPDPVKSATAKPKASFYQAPSFKGYDATVPRTSSRSVGDVRLSSSRSDNSVRQGRAVTSSLPQPIKPAVKPTTKPRLQRTPTVAGKRSLDRAPRVSIRWEAPKTEAKKPARAGTKKPAARSSDRRDARRVEKDSDWKDLDRKRARSKAEAKKLVEALKKEPFQCKERPKDSRPKKGGGGSRDFIPWC